VAEGKIIKNALRIWHLLLLLFGIALIVRYDLKEAGESVSRAPSLEELVEVFSGQLNAALKNDPVPHYQGTVETGVDSIPAACVSTTQMPPKVKAYVDEINTLVVIDRTGTIRGIKIISHRETPAYMIRLLEAGFLDRFRGRKVSPKMAVEIDTVTGASITARAIVDDVAAASSLAASRLFGIAVPEPELPAWSAALKDPGVIAVSIALAAALYARFGRWPKRGRKEAAWVVSILLIGIYAMTPYTLVHSFQLLKLNVPGPANALLLVLAGFVIVTTAISGPVYCAYACPFGALQELLYRIPARRWKVTPGIMRYARELRYLVLFASVFGVFGLGIHAFSEVEPFGHLFSRTQSLMAWVFIAFTLFIAIFVKRFWCRFFCPTGACLIILSSHRRFLRHVDRGVDDSGIDRSDIDTDESRDLG